MLDVQLELTDKGWVLLKCKKNWGQEELLNLARHIGSPVSSRLNGNIIDELRPTNKEQANPKSLSAIHGTGSFPLHTDTAHWRIPARYVILHAKEITLDDHSTSILDLNRIKFDEKENELLSRGMFKIVNGRNSFLSTIRGNVDQTRSLRYRFDRGCMEPSNKSGIEAYNLFCEKLDSVPTEVIRWERGNVLIIHNWRCLHGRNNIDKANYQNGRTLERLLVK